MENKSSAGRPPKREGSSEICTFLNFSFCFSPLSPSLPGSSDEDEDDDGVTAAAFLKKKSEVPSGESRKFLKKEVRARVTLRGGLLAVDHAWVSREKNRLSGA